MLFKIIYSRVFQDSTEIQTRNYYFEVRKGFLRQFSSLWITASKSTQ